MLPVLLAISPEIAAAGLQMHLTYRKHVRFGIWVVTSRSTRCFLASRVVWSYHQPPHRSVAMSGRRTFVDIHPP
eukprot:scaffold553126_cov18-Prasinocladus_malaysianus.AAC.1